MAMPSRRPRWPTNGPGDFATRSATARCFRCVWGLWLFHKVRSELAMAQRLADELLRLAREANDPDLALQAHQALAMTAFCRGMPTLSLGHVEQAAALYDRESHTVHADQFGQDPGVICKAFGAVVLWLLGYPDAAARESEAAISMSENTSPSSQAIAFHFAAMVHQLRRDPTKTRMYAERCSAVASRTRIFALDGRQRNFSEVGRSPRRAISQAASRPCEAASGTGKPRAPQLTALTSLASLPKRFSIPAAQAEASGLLDDAIQLADRTGEGLFAAELHRLRAAAAARVPSPSTATIDRAEGEFRRALAIATEQQARSLQLRAASSRVQMEAMHGGDSDRVSRIAVPHPCELLGRF